MLRDRLHPSEDTDPAEAAKVKLVEVEKALENLLNIATHSSSGSAALANRLDMLEEQRAKLTEEIVAAQPGQGPKVRDEDILRVADEVTRQAEVLLEADGELLAELAPRFIKEFLVDKKKRVVEAHFYEVPGLQLVVPRSCIEVVEAGGVEPPSEMVQP